MSNDAPANKPEGEKLNEITSEITNIMKLEVLAAEATTEADAVRRYDVLIGKIKTHISSRVAKTKTKEDDELFKGVITKHKDDKLEQVKPETTPYRGSRIVRLIIGDDTSTRCDCYIENYAETLKAMIEMAYERLKELRIEQYNELKEIISDEFNLHKDMTDNGMTPDSLKGRYKSNGKI